MWKAIGISVALLAAILLLSVTRNGRAGLDPRDELAFERQQAQQRQVLLASAAPGDAALSCAAARAHDTTVQTLYVVWINHRPDLAPAPDREAASTDLTNAIATCGGDAGREEDLAHRRGVDLEQAAASVMLRSGR